MILIYVYFFLILIFFVTLTFIFSVSCIALLCPSLPLSHQSAFSSLPSHLQTVFSDLFFQHSSSQYLNTSPALTPHWFPPLISRQCPPIFSLSLYFLFSSGSLRFLFILFFFVTYFLLKLQNLLSASVYCIWVHHHHTHHDNFSCS